MKLYLNGSSPYSRLVRIILTETGLAESCEYAWVDPWSEPEELLAVSPSAKIPALLTGEGPALVESRVICDYLIERSGRRDLQAADLHSLQILGLAQAAMDCAFGAVIQQRFNADSLTLNDLWQRALPRISSALETVYAERNGEIAPNLADYCVVTAYEYIDFRLGTLAWRRQAPKLAQWLETIKERPSLRDSRPC